MLCHVLRKPLCVLATKHWPKRRVLKLLKSQPPPDLFICGHSHIAKVQRDERFGMLTMNPGAAGKHGFHRMRTVFRFAISEGRVHDLEVIELGLRGKLI